MSTQTFPVGQAPRLILTECRRDLTIETWDERAIEVESDDPVGPIGQEGDALLIERAEGDLHLRVPADTAVSVERVRGDADIQGVRAITIGVVDGDCQLAEIFGDARLRSVGGDVVARDVSTLEIEQIGGDCAINVAQTVSVGDVGGDATIKDVREALRYGSIGGDLVVQGGERTAIAGGGVGGDLAIDGALSVQAGDVGGDAALKNAVGDLQLGSVGGDCAIKEAAGALSVGHIGGDCAIVHSGAELRIGNVGGDLALKTGFSPESVTRITIGGDAMIDLPQEPNLTIRATVGGDVRGQRMVSASGGLFTIVYGEGAARLDLIVGGDLDLRGGGAPRTSSSSWGAWDEHGEFAEEMGRLGEEMGRLGEELGRELSAAFGGEPRRVRRGADRARQRAEEQARGVAERARHEGEAARRFHVRVGDREWRFDAERLERLKQQAREAAREGVAGALEAVERALAGIGAPPPPPSSAAPHSGEPFVTPPPAAPPPPATGATIRMAAQPEQGGTETAEAAPTASSESAPPPNVEAERAAILQMVAEGRISPEEGDMLLDALG